MSDEWKAEALRLREQLATLMTAAQKTLDENGHLCDGDVCTLKDLRDAVELTSNPLQLNGIGANFPAEQPYNEVTATIIRGILTDPESVKTALLRAA